jgi:hypothetical protein
MFRYHIFLFFLLGSLACSSDTLHKKGNVIKFHLNFKASRTSFIFSESSSYTKYYKYGSYDYGESHYSGKMKAFSLNNPEIIMDVELAKHAKLIFGFQRYSFKTKTPDIDYKYYSSVNYVSNMYNPSVVSTVLYPNGSDIYSDELTFSNSGFFMGYGKDFLRKRWTFGVNLSLNAQFLTYAQVTRKYRTKNVHEEIILVEDNRLKYFIGNALTVSCSYRVLEHWYINGGAEYAYYYNSNKTEIELNNPEYGITVFNIKKMNQFNLFAGIAVKLE